MDTYLARLDTSYVQSLTKEAHSFQAALAVSTLPSPVQEVMADRLATYRTAFLTLVERL